jgi:hypothetical protein
MNKSVLRSLCGIASIVGTMTVVLPAAWGATVAKPFEITKFTMQTTAPTKMVPIDQGGVVTTEFNNDAEEFTQAGSHPWGLTTTVEFASEELELHDGSSIDHVIVPTRDPKDIVVTLPPGLLGNPMATPRCPLAILLAGIRCPPSTQIGVYRVRWFDGKEFLGPIINVMPEAGQSAEFSLENEAKINPVLTAHLVRTAQGYGFTVISNEIPEVELSRVETTFWGVPADPSHDAMRGLLCGTTSRNETGLLLPCQSTGGHEAGVSPIPFLTMPTDCTNESLVGSVRADSWQEPGRVEENQRFVGYVEKNAEEPLPTVLEGGFKNFSDCSLLGFDPTVDMQPDTTVADEPVGLGVNVKVPLNEKPEGVATPQLRDATVTLPEGMSVSPGVVDGIQACDANGPNGINITGPESEMVGLNGELQLAPGHCPDASIVGTAEAITPFLPIPVKGHVFLARPGCGGPAQDACTEKDALDGNLYQLYLELGGEGELADTGIEIKVAGKTEANPATGQLTTKFLENPQAPFSELRIHLNGGPRAPIANPSVCGQAVTTADFVPWSAPGETEDGLLVAGTPDATPSAFFDVTGCANPVSLTPGFTAGTVTPQAGQFSAFTVNLSRADREQYLKGIQLHTPPGLLGMLSSVPLCGEPEADDGHCPESSKIGTTRVASGAGSHPFEISGKVYLTGPYRGAPFGLSIVTDAVAGPFNLGLVVVRARIMVDPESSTLTVTTDETGPYAIPQIIFGVPLRLKRVTVDIDRPGFMFNPTDCAARQISATVSGSGNSTANVSTPFAVGGCKSLGFKPKFAVSTSGRTSRAKGASLDAKVSYPSGAMGSQANIASVKVSLPKQLPSRLTTLQKACPDATFKVNPGACPPASIVGIVRATTPLLPVGLSGPVYFVSHGGEAFPSLIVVLQGDGVRVDLTGTTFINKAGITSSTFKTVPDVPVGSFELYLPEGRYSALAANGNLCKSRAKLLMPTEMVAQNGLRLKQNTKIAVTGCNARTAKTERHRHRSRGARSEHLSIHMRRIVQKTNANRGVGR